MSEKYSILRVLGRGGMGVVYEAVHNDLERHVALKVLRSERRVDDDIVARFRLEMTTCASLSHPNIVRVLDSGETADGQLFFTMDLLEGADLTSRAKSLEAYPVADAIDLLAQAVDALGYLHERGMIHRDVKPANFMVSPSGHLTLTDFGVVKLSGGERLTATGLVPGSPRFLAPEALTGQGDTAAQDVYALGLTFWQVLAGRPWYPGDSKSEMVRWTLEEVPPPLATVRPDAPEWLCALIDRCLAKAPSSRPTSEELARVFQRGGDGAASLPPGRPARSTRGTRKHAKGLDTTSRKRVAVPRPAVALAVGAAIGVACVLSMLRAREKATPVAPPSAVVTAPPSASAEVPRPAELSDTVPIREFACLPSDDAVVVDFDNLTGAALEVELGDPASGGVLRTVRQAPDRVRCRVFFEGLRGESSYFARVRRAGGPALIEAYRFRTSRGSSADNSKWLQRWVVDDTDVDVATSAPADTFDPRVLPIAMSAFGRASLPREKRAALAVLFEQSRSPECADLLVNLIEHETDGYLATHYLTALGATRDERAVALAPRVVKQFDADEHDTEEKAAAALSGIAGLATFRYYEERLTKLAGWAPLAEAVVSADEQAACALATRLLEHNGGTGPRVRSVGLQIAAATQAAALADLLARQLDPAVGGIWSSQAAELLSANPDARAGKRLAEAVRACPGVPALILAAGRAGRADVVPDLVRATAVERPRDERAAAALALGMIADGPALRKSEFALPTEPPPEPPAAAVQALVAMLKDADVPMRETAAWALGHCRSPAAAAALRVHAASEADASGRGAMALAEQGDRGAVAVLGGVLASLPADISAAGQYRRAMVMLALARLGDMSARGSAASLERDPAATPFARFAAREVLREIDPAAVRGVRRIFVDPIAPIVRTGVMLAAGQSIDIRALGVWGWGTPEQAWRAVDAVNEEIPKRRSLNVVARLGPLTVVPRPEWVRLVAVRPGELVLLTQGQPLRNPPGEDRGLLPTSGVGLARVELRP